VGVSSGLGSDTVEMVIGLFVHVAAAPIFWISVYLTAGCYGEFHPYS
jgi:hypothetical protein